MEPEATTWRYLDSGKRHKTKLELAWHVLRGRPLIYRAEVGTIYVKGEGPMLYVVDTHIRTDSKPELDGCSVCGSDTAEECFCGELSR